MKQLIARSALNDLQDIQRYYSDQGVPEVGQQLVSGLLAKAQIREIIHPPFRVVYLRDASVVNLVRVWRSERLLLPES